MLKEILRGSFIGKKTGKVFGKHGPEVTGRKVWAGAGGTLWENLLIQVSYRIAVPLEKMCYVAIVYPKKNVINVRKEIATGLINWVPGGLRLPRFGGLGGILKELKIWLGTWLGAAEMTF